MNLMLVISFHIVLQQQAFHVKKVHFPSIFFKRVS